MGIRLTVVGKTWARILVALAAGAVTGLFSARRARSLADDSTSSARAAAVQQQAASDVALAGSR